MKRDGRRSLHVSSRQVSTYAYNLPPMAMTTSSPCSSAQRLPLCGDFTGKERDESRLDYFGARYYSAAQGRFLTPDPAGNAVADTSNPQSWNQYAYAMNNPLIFTDPTGQECVWDDGSYDSADDPDTGSAAQCSNLGGTWIGSDVFGSSNYYAGDWSPESDLSRAVLVGDIHACSAAVGGGQAASLLIADSFASGFGNNMTAYVLGTAAVESGPGIGRAMSERGGASYWAQYNERMGNTAPGDGYTYRGRGYVGLTGKWSYGYWSKQLGVNLVANPELAATPDIAAQIAVEGMDRGSFRPGNSLYDYINPSDGVDFIGARNVVNGKGDRAGDIANIANGYASALVFCR
jgi:RHS repeat-associated protein